MKKRYYYIFRRLLFYMFSLCPIMIEAQNTQNYRLPTRQMQMEMNTHLSTIDSIANVCYQEVATIRNDVDTLKLGWDVLMNDIVDMKIGIDSLSNSTCSFIDHKTKEPNWDKKGVRWTIGSIFVMILVFILTSIQTKKQVNSQHEDTLNQISEQSRISKKQINSQRRNTNRHIKTQQDLTQQQISEMRSQSETRLASLEEMGNKIKGFTSEIQESVKHFERTYIGKDDSSHVFNLIIETETENESLYQILSNDFLTFEDTSNSDKTKYAKGVLKIKTNLDRIQNILKYYAPDGQMPDFQAYLEALQKIINGPDFDIMDEQLMFYDLGKTYCEDISHVATIIFSNHESNNTQIS